VAALYWVGRGSSRWQDRRNWSRKSGGPGGASPPDGTVDVVIDAGSGSGEVDLRGCPYRGLKIRPGCAGAVVGPFGDGPTRFGRGEGTPQEATLEDAPRVVDYRPDVPERCPFCGQSDAVVTGEYTRTVGGPFGPDLAALLEAVYSIEGDDPVEFTWATWTGDGVACTHSGPELVDSVELVGPYQAVA
jgi:hypothetical protein